MLRAHVCGIEQAGGEQAGGSQSRSLSRRLKCAKPDTAFAVPRNTVGRREIGGPVGHTNQHVCGRKDFGHVMGLHESVVPGRAVKWKAAGCYSAAFTCHRFDMRMDRKHWFFGRYEDRLVRSDDGPWQIAHKTIILLNDTVPTVLDISAISGRNV